MNKTKLMENTAEKKAMFFAQYMFQQVLMWHDTSILYAVDGSDLAIVSTKKTEYFLELKPLSSITDKDAKLICDELKLPRAKRFYVGESLVTYKDDTYTVVFYYDGFVSVLKNDGLLLIETKQANDIAISMGFALQWMGLSVNKLIDCGWIKLEEA